MFYQYKGGINSIKASVFFLPVLFLFFSCSESSTSSQQNPLFNSEKYFSGESARLSAEVRAIQKIVVRNSKMDSAQVAITNWKKELEPFSQCNISKPSMRNSYLVDSVSDGTSTRITYSAREPQLAVRKVEVVSSQDRVVRLHMESAESNELYSTTRYLDYVPDSGYRISGSQQMTLGEKTDYHIKAVWK